MAPSQFSQFPTSSAIAHFHAFSLEIRENVAVHGNPFVMNSFFNDPYITSDPYITVTVTYIAVDVTDTSDELSA